MMDVVQKRWTFLGLVFLSVFQSTVDCWKLKHTELIGNKAVNPKIDYKTFYLSVPVDHFGYSNEDRFQLRYLVADQYWDKGSGPIFLYTGNEGDIEWFCNNTGFLWDIAPEFKALLIFVEHRYYGKSLPYGKDSYKDLEHVGYLSSEQALADFAVTIEHFKSSTPGAENRPVIAFGGSYGGMLAAWFRIKYPHVVLGSLAASAPVLWFGDLTPCNAFSKVVTQDFQRASPQCSGNIKRSWAVIGNMAKTESGRATISKYLRLCDPLKKPSDGDVVKSWLVETYGNLAMVDYPYPASFLEPLPGWPIKEVCKHLASKDLMDEEIIVALGNGINVYYNYTGQAKCFNTSQQATGNLGDQGWGFQACTEMVMPMCSDGVSDMFEPEPWNLTEFAASCKKQWGVNTRPKWAITEYGGRNITASSNIIFSNGKLDPWSGGGFMESVSKSIVSIVIDEGAHHLDLRSSNPKDPKSVLKAREMEKSILRSWLQDYTGDREEDLSYHLLKLPTLAQNANKGMILGATIAGASLCLLLLVTILFKHKNTAQTRMPGYAPLKSDDKYPIM